MPYDWNAFMLGVAVGGLLDMLLMMLVPRVVNKVKRRLDTRKK